MFRITLLNYTCRALSLLSAAFVFAEQNHRVSLAWEDISITDALAEIESKSPYHFFYESELIDPDTRVSLQADRLPVKDALDQILEETNLIYTLVNEHIVLKVEDFSQDQQQVQQQRTVVGLVLDSDNNALPGVTVRIKGTSNGVLTDFKGNYSIEVPDNSAILEFSHLGFRTVEVEVQDFPEIHITLEEDVRKLDEIVLLGYNQEAKKDNLTGSISTLEGDALVRMGNTNVDVAFSGLIPGVQVTRNSGQAGEGASIRIRGTTSVLGSNEPLYVVDGIPMTSSFENYFGDSSNTDDDGATFSPLNPLSTISPEDIAKITVLKDASATAIYGSRGANGVILIETKKGKQQPQLQFGYSFSSYRPTNAMDVLDANQIKSYLTPIMNTLRQANPFAGVPNPEDYFLEANTNWQKAILQNAPKHNYHLSFSDASEKSSYQVSLNVVDETGIVQKTDFKRYNTRVNLTSNPMDFLTLGVQLNYSQSEQNLQQNIYRSAIITRPDIPAYNPDGSIFEYYDPNDPSQENFTSRFATPLQRINARTHQRTNERLFGSVFGEIQWSPRLKSRTSLFLDQYQVNTLQIIAPKRILPREGSRRDNTQDFQSIVFDQTLNYKTAWQGGHHLDVLMGVSFTNNQTDIRSTQLVGFDDPSLVFPQNAQRVISDRVDHIPDGLISYLGRVNYDYNNKYLATLTFRRDASTKFGVNNQWGNFPSFAMGWNMAEESFLNSKTINTLKLRASWGVTGSSNFSNFLFGSYYGLGSRYRQIEGRLPIGVGNHDIKWERTQQADVGIDFSLWDQRISGSLNWYEKNTEDLLLVVNVPNESGFSTQITNAGTVRNRGLEFQFNSQIIKTTDFQWQLDGNISWNNNLVTHVSPLLAQRQSVTTWGYNPNSVLQKGSPLGAFYGYEVDGVIQSEEELQSLNAASETGFYQNYQTAVGDYKFKDLDGNNRIDHRDQKVIGNPNPKGFGGLQSLWRYKRWTANLNFQFQWGNDIALVSRSSSFDPFESFQDIYYGYNFNYRSEVLEAWSPDRPNSTLASSPNFDRNNNRRFSNRSIHDGSYLRLKNIRLGYSVPQSWSWTQWFQDLNVFFSATNLWTWTKYPGLDPELVSQPGYNNYNGFDQSFFPQTKFYSLGFNISF